jgi:hypothetical protein
VDQIFLKLAPCLSTHVIDVFFAKLVPKNLDFIHVSYDCLSLFFQVFDHELMCCNIKIVSNVCFNSRIYEILSLSFAYYPKKYFVWVWVLVYRNT